MLKFLMTVMPGGEDDEDEARKKACLHVCDYLRPFAHVFTGSPPVDYTLDSRRVRLVWRGVIPPPEMYRNEEFRYGRYLLRGTNAPLPFPTPSLRAAIDYTPETRTLGLTLVRDY